MLKSERPGWDGKGPEDLSLTWLLSNCLSDKDVFSCSCKRRALQGLEAFIIAGFWREALGWVPSPAASRVGCWPWEEASVPFNLASFGVCDQGQAEPPRAVGQSQPPSCSWRAPTPGRGAGAGGDQNRNGKSLPSLHFWSCFEVECSWNTLLNLVFSVL